jgi:hypothetical protein
MLGIYAKALHPAIRRVLMQAFGEAVAGRPELAGALLAALPSAELAGALQVVMEAYASLLAEAAPTWGRGSRLGGHELDRRSSQCAGPVSGLGSIQCSGGSILASTPACSLSR